MSNGVAAPSASGHDVPIHLTIAMRQLNPITNLVLSCLAAVGLVASLELPWYATSPAAENVGPMEAMGARLLRTFTSDGATTTGTDALGTSRTILLVAAGAVIVLCTAMLLPALRGVLRDLTRAVAIATPMAVLATAVRAAEGLELRWGLVVTVAVGLFMANATWHGAAARQRREAPAPGRRAIT
jgi:hypothetical protein